MRSRNIKPGFWQNEVLPECSPHARLLFIGLWSLCDWTGRMERRPKRILMSIFPYEQHLEIEALLEELESRGFISSYDDRKHLVINNFQKHQNPVTKERSIPSKFPDPNRVVAGSLLGRSMGEAGIIPVPLIPDSLKLIPDSPGIEPVGSKPKSDLPEKKKQVVSAFNAFAEKKGWFPLTGRPSKMTNDLLTKFCEDPSRFAKLDEYMAKVSESTMEACRIDVWLRENSFNKIMSGEWGPKNSVYVKPQEQLDLSKPWNVVKEPASAS